MHHRHHRRWVSRAVVLVGSAGVLTLAGCTGLGARVHEQRSMNVAHQANSALSIVTANGSVLAERQARGDVLIEVDLYGPDAERLSFATVHADRQGDGSLRVWIEWPGGKRKNNEGAHIDVQIPDAIGVDVRTSNGNITLLGLAGHAEVDTSNGKVVVRDHSGSVNADSSNGALRLENVDAEIVASTSNGSVTVTDAFGAVDVQTSNGSVFVSTAHSNPGPVRVLSSNGRIKLELGDGFEGVLKVKTSNAKILVGGFEQSHLVQSKGYVEMKIGDSDTVSAVKTSNGSVSVSARGHD